MATPINLANSTDFILIYADGTVKSYPRDSSRHAVHWRIGVMRPVFCLVPFRESTGQPLISEDLVAQAHCSKDPLCGQLVYYKAKEVPHGYQQNTTP